MKIANKKKNIGALKKVFILILSLFVGIYLLYWYVGSYERIRYEYDMIPIEYEGGEILIFLFSDFKVIDKRHYIHGSPYDLVINVKTDTESEGKASLNNMKLIDEGGEIIFASNDNIELDFKEVSDGFSRYNTAPFRWKTLQLEYRNYTVVFDLSIRTNKFEVDKRIEAPFKKIYKKERSNKIFDAAMGV